MQWSNHGVAEAVNLLEQNFINHWNATKQEKGEIAETLTWVSFNIQDWFLSNRTNPTYPRPNPNSTDWSSSFPHYCCCDWSFTSGAVPQRAVGVPGGRQIEKSLGVVATCVDICGAPALTKPIGSRENIDPSDQGEKVLCGNLRWYNI